MRLFAAVLPPAQAADELASVLDRRVRGLPGADGLRWTGREGWHFTLAFMGEVDDRLLPELTERLGRAAHRTDAFSLRLHGGGRFGGRALWAAPPGASRSCGGCQNARTPRRAARGCRWRNTVRTIRI